MREAPAARRGRGPTSITDPTWSAEVGTSDGSSSHQSAKPGAAGQHCENDRSASAQLSVSRGRRRFRTTSTRSSAGSHQHELRSTGATTAAGQEFVPRLARRKRFRRRGHRLPSHLESDGGRLRQGRQSYTDGPTSPRPSE